MEILIIISYFACKGVQDAILATGKGFNWRNKYKQPFESLDTLHPIYKAYHQAVGAAYKEKFFLSASLLVAFSDFWHFTGLLRHLNILALCYIISGYEIALTLIVYTMGLITFNFVYTVIKSKK